MSRDDASLLDIARAARKCKEFKGELTFDDFVADERTRSAVLHPLTIIGEAAKRLSREFTQAHPHIPWRLIAGMRDRLVHAYDAVDIDDVWLAIDRDVPRLLADIEPRLPRGRD